MNKQLKDKLYLYFIHYNHYTNTWNAVKRDKSNQYLNGDLDKEDLLIGSRIEDVLRAIDISGN